MIGRASYQKYIFFPDLHFGKVAFAEATGLQRQPFSRLFQGCCKNVGAWKSTKCNQWCLKLSQPSNLMKSKHTQHQSFSRTAFVTIFPVEFFTGCKAKTAVKTAKPTLGTCMPLPGTITQFLVWGMAEIHGVLEKQSVWVSCKPLQNDVAECPSNQALATFALAHAAPVHGNPKVSSISRAVTMRFLSSDLTHSNNYIIYSKNLVFGSKLKHHSFSFHLCVAELPKGPCALWGLANVSACPQSGVVPVGSDSRSRTSWLATSSCILPSEFAETCEWPTMTLRKRQRAKHVVNFQQAESHENKHARSPCLVKSSSVTESGSMGLIRKSLAGMTGISLAGEQNEVH